MVTLEDVCRIIGAAKDLDSSHAPLDPGARRQGLAVAMFMRPVRDTARVHTHDYRAAIAEAVAWLGDRYLLAKPIKSTAARPATAGVQMRSS